MGVTEILTAQGLEHPDHDAVYKTLFASFTKAGPWGNLLDGDGRLDRQHMLGGPLPAWTSTWDIWVRQWEMTFAEHDLDGDPRQAADHTRQGLAAADPYPDARETVGRLADHGYTLGLLSNADDDFLHSALGRSGLSFSTVLSSEALRAYKPNCVTFDALCERLGCEPSAVLYVGDSLPTDVQGARHAGLRTVWVRRSDREFPEELPRPDVEVASLSALPGLLGAS